jgi:hypothetical protein
MAEPSSRKENELGTIDQHQLEEAEQLFEDDKPGQAAPIFAALADKALSTTPKRAATLHAQAALAYVASRSETNAVTQARTALRMFHQYHMAQAETFYYNKIVSELNDRKMTKAANALANEFVDQISLPDVQLRPKPEQSFQETAPRLPALCPHCDGPLRSDEGQWLDSDTMLCMYCGTPVRAEG